MTSGAGANGLQAMVPAAAAGAVESDAGRLARRYTTQTIKGISYAIFAAPAGSYGQVRAATRRRRSSRAYGDPFDRHGHRPVGDRRARHLERRVRDRSRQPHPDGVALRSS